MTAREKLEIFAVCYLLSAVCYGQGYLPPKESSSTATTAPQGPLLIGDKVPESLLVLDQNGKERSLLSYKSAVEVMVIGFFSASCPADQMRWYELKHFYEDYQGWGVSFVAVNMDPPTRGALTKQMSKAGLPYSVVDGESRALTTTLKVESIPKFLILDEEGYLLYRGPMGKEARRAIEAIIGHMAAVPNPEPTTSGGCPLP
jgi:hypothetical protein